MMPRFQYDLKTLLLFFVVVAAAVATFGIGGFLVIGWLALTALIVRDTRSVREAISNAVVLIAIGLCLSGLLLPSMERGRSGALLYCCQINMKCLGIALYNYSDKNGSFPPAYIADGQGKPLVSWRCLLTPELERTDIFERYDRSQPWNSPKNLPLTQQHIEQFHCSEDSGGKNSSQTSYVAVVGPETVWPGERPVKLEEITDGPENTILLIEVKNSGISYLEPRDLTYKEVVDAWKSPTPPEKFLSHVHLQKNRFLPRLETPVIGTNVLFADGSVYFLTAQDMKKHLPALLTRNGGEEVGEFRVALSKRDDKTGYFYRWLCSLLVFVIAVAAFCWRIRKHLRPHNRISQSDLEKSLEAKSIAADPKINHIPKSESPSE